MSAHDGLHHALVKCLYDAFEGQVGAGADVDRWFRHVRLNGSFNLEIVANKVLKLVHEETPEKQGVD